jgi:hypothetical protein
MSLDFSTLIWIVIAAIALQPLIMGRWFSVKRTQAIRALEKAHGSRVITMIHRQEKRSLFGFNVSRRLLLLGLAVVLGCDLRSRSLAPSSPRHDRHR